MIAISELEAARSVMKEKMPFGEPAVALDPCDILVSSKNPSEIHIRMDDLIKLVERILKTHLKIDGAS